MAAIKTVTCMRVFMRVPDTTNPMLSGFIAVTGSSHLRSGDSRLIPLIALNIGLEYVIIVNGENTHMVEGITWRA